MTTTTQTHPSAPHRTSKKAQLANHYQDMVVVGERRIAELGRLTQSLRAFGQPMLVTLDSTALTVSEEERRQIFRHDKPALAS